MLLCSGQKLRGSTQNLIVDRSDQHMSVEDLVAHVDMKLAISEKKDLVNGLRDNPKRPNKFKTSAVNASNPTPPPTQGKGKGGGKGESANSEQGQPKGRGFGNFSPRANQGYPRPGEQSKNFAKGESTSSSKAPGYQAENARWSDERLCWFCNQKGHFRRDCPGWLARLESEGKKPLNTDSNVAREGAPRRVEPHQDASTSSSSSSSNRNVEPSC